VAAAGTKVPAASAPRPTSSPAATAACSRYFGDWDSTDNFLRAPLCSGWTLANAWAGRPHWVLHPMGLGETLGTAAKLSQNDTTHGGFGGRSIHVALMGDPTLRQHVVAPASGVVVTDQWPQASVSWSPSVDQVAGYHVYRAPSPGGPFTRLTTVATAGTVFVDPAPIAGAATYMVRALRLETTPTGSYWNPSQGAFASATLPQQPAVNVAYGSGCYRVSDSIWQQFADLPAASAALQGTSIAFTPNGGGYDVTAGGGTFAMPGPWSLLVNPPDDGQWPVNLPQPFPFPGGSTSTLYVHDNGIVAASMLAMSAAASAAPSAATMLGEPAPAWYSWHDFVRAEGGDVHYELIGNVAHVTWLAVESHPVGVFNRSVFQFQFDLATGVVRLVWQLVANVGAGGGGPPWEQWLVGWSPGGPSVDGGPIDFASALPRFVGPDNLEPLRLTATPPPVVTPTTGVTLTYTIDHTPAWAPGTSLGFLVVGFVPDLAGSDLASFGLPGCVGWLGSYDVTQLFVGSGPTNTSPLALPAGLPPGLAFHAQALALVPPGSLPGGLNALGGVTSNGVRSFVNGF
jgi:hypothetical protein